MYFAWPTKGTLHRQLLTTHWLHIKTAREQGRSDNQEETANHLKYIPEKVRNRTEMLKVKFCSIKPLYF